MRNYLVKEASDYRHEVLALAWFNGLVLQTSRLTAAVFYPPDEGGRVTLDPSRHLHILPVAVISKQYDGMIWMEKGQGDVVPRHLFQAVSIGRCARGSEAFHDHQEPGVNTERFFDSAFPRRKFQDWLPGVFGLRPRPYVEKSKRPTAIGTRD
ncbi:hypothetical protein Cpir12675_005427 [Ceratocystis pirilliformis]|uniref:Uncharacterized protein n=1 Tax=Ceratocystis pirilliformis TaxID=259994 RepID=A0ABR3YPY9_9PEZI